MAVAAAEIQTTSSGVPRSFFVVDDEALILLMFEDIAAELGWTIAGTAVDEITALQLLTDVQPSVAVIDINLANTTGFGVAAACRARGIPVLFVTASGIEDVPQECGTDPVLHKPFSIEDFGQALECRASTQGTSVV